MALRARDACAVLQELLGRRRCPEICVQYSCGHSQEAQVTLPPVLQKKEGRLNGRAAAQVLKTQFKRCDRGRSIACGGACTGAASTTAGCAAAAAEDDRALQFQVEIPPGRCSECARHGIPEEEHGERTSLRCGGALVDLPSNSERLEEAIPVGVGARQMLQWLQAPPQAKPHRVALLGLRPEVAGGDLACSVSDCVREATGWSPLVLAGLAWLVGCVAYGFRQVPGDPSVNPDLLYEQFQRRIHDIPVAQQSPQYEQYRQYYLQQYEQHLQEHGALQEQWERTRSVFNWQALLHSLGVGVLIFAAVLAYCEYHYGTISFWMELAEEFWCNCQERLSKPRDPLGDSQRMDRFLRELGEEKPAAAAAPNTPTSSSPVATSRPLPREEKRRPEPTQTDPRSQASPAVPAVPLTGPVLSKQPVLSSRAPEAVSARKEQSPPSGVAKQRTSLARKVAAVPEPLLPADQEEPLREPSPERWSQAQDTAPDDQEDEGCPCATSLPQQQQQQQQPPSPQLQTTSWPGHMWEAAAAAAAGQVWEDPAGPSVGSSRLGSSRPVQDGSGSNVRERLRRKVVERNKEHIRSAVTRVIEPLPPKPKQKEKRAVNGTELLREAEELFCQLEAESLLKQLAEEEERKKTSARKKAAKRRAAKGMEPGPEGSSVGEDPKQAGSGNSDDGACYRGSQVIDDESTKGEEAEEAKTTTVGSLESCPDEDNAHSETPPSSEVHSTPVQDPVEPEEGHVLRYLAEILEDGTGEVKQELMKVATNARRRKRERNTAHAPPAADRPAAPIQAATRQAAVPQARNYQEMQQRSARSSAGQSRITADKPRRPFLPPAPTWQAPNAPEVEVEPPTTPSVGMTEKVSTRVKNTFLEFEDDTLNRQGQGNRVRASSLPCMRCEALLEDSGDQVESAKFAENCVSSTVGAACQVEGAKFGKASVPSKVAAACGATLPCRSVHDARHAAEGTSRNKAILVSQRKEARPHDSRGKQSFMNSARDRRDANRLGVWDDLSRPASRVRNETSRLGVWDDPPRRSKATKLDANDRPDPNLGRMFSPRGGRAAGAVLLRALHGDESDGGPDAKAYPRPRAQRAAAITGDGVASEALVEERQKLDVQEEQQDEQQEETSPLSAKAGTLRAEAPEFVPAPAFTADQSMAAGMPVQMVPWQMVSMPLPEAMQLMSMPGTVPGLVMPPLNLPLPEPGLASGEATPSPRDLADDMLTQQMEMLRFRLETVQAMIAPCSEAMTAPCSEAMLQSCGEDALQLCGNAENQGMNISRIEHASADTLLSASELVVPEPACKDCQWPNTPVVESLPQTV